MVLAENRSSLKGEALRFFPLFSFEDVVDLCDKQCPRVTASSSTEAMTRTVGSPTRGNG
jgi:hypothetical protein